VRYFSIVLNLFYSACFALCLEESGSSALPVSFFLDEFGNLGKVHELASVVTTLRKRRCSVSLILQELSQLDAVYGRHEARTIFAGGCANKLFFSGLDLDTSRYIEGMLGSNTEYDTLFGGVDERARTIGVPLMRSDQVRMLRGREAVLISGSKRPVRVKMPPYFEVGTWSRLAAKAPATPRPVPDSGPVPLVDLQGNQLLPTVVSER
jgi:type IV secretory pathway TraG/TraD family ATPase VirD4